MTLKLLLTGDSILQRRLQSRSDPELKPLFDKVRAADVAFTNLEVLANDYRGDPALECGGSHFGAPAWVLDELVEAGFGLFATATNHALDYSISGLRAFDRGDGGARALLRRRRPPSRGRAAALLSHPSARHRGDDFLRLVLRQGPGGGGGAARPAGPARASIRCTSRPCTR